MTSLSTLVNGAVLSKPRLMTEEESKQYEHDQRVNEYRQNISSALIPERYRHADLRTCDPDAELYMQDLRSRKWRNLVITGKARSGKTHTACAILKQHMWESGLSGCFVSMERLLSEIKQTIGRPVDEDSVVFRYTSKRLLVIDDFGKERFTQWSIPMIWRIFDRRYNAMRPTIVTSQYSVEQLSDSLKNGGADDEMIQAIVRRIVDPLMPDDKSTNAMVIKPKAVGLSA